MTTEPWTSRLAPDYSVPRGVGLCVMVPVCFSWLSRLVDGVNVTTSDEHMWLVPFSEGVDHLLTVTLDTPQQVSGIRVWNYNKTPEDTFRGVSSPASNGTQWLTSPSSPPLPPQPPLLLSLRQRLFMCG